jgi:rare lipoprotein A
MVGTTVGALRLSPAADTGADDLAATSAATAATSPTPDRVPERADRGETRATEAPTSTPSAAPRTVPAAPPPTAPTGPAVKALPPPPKPGGSVVDSGTCKASFYTDHGSPTASGKPFDVNQLWTAHKTLKFGTKVHVTNVANGRSVDVIVMDRGPFTPGRCLDLTPRAFDAIANRSAGVVTVKYEVLNG